MGGGASGPRKPGCPRFGAQDFAIQMTHLHTRAQLPRLRLLGTQTEREPYSTRFLWGRSNMGAEKVLTLWDVAKCR